MPVDPLREDLVADDALFARARAGRELIAHDPRVDRLAVLALVVWPSPELERERPRRSQGTTRDDVDQIFRLAAEGVNQREIAAEVFGARRYRVRVGEILRMGQERARERYR